MAFAAKKAVPAVSLGALFLAGAVAWLVTGDVAARRVGALG